MRFDWEKKRKLCKSCAHTWRVVLWHLCRLFGRGCCYLSLADVIAVFLFYCVDVRTSLSADESAVRSRSLVCVWNDSNCVEFNESRKVSRFSLLKSFATYTSLFRWRVYEEFCSVHSGTCFYYCTHKWYKKAWRRKTKHQAKGGVKSAWITTKTI